MKKDRVQEEPISAPLVVCLVSGGLDSCVAAAVAAVDNHLAFLHVNYGQRTQERELTAFNDIADYYEVKQRLVVSIDHFKAIGGSALTDPEIIVPHYTLDDPGVPMTYVPFRNTHILAIAVSWAEVIGAEYIYIGAMEEDSSGYPDCRREYFDAYNVLIEKGTRPETKIQIIAPLLLSTKGAVVEEGLALKAPLHLTWSCYQNQGVACGHCDSCLLRLRGFAAAGATDPITYVKPTTQF